MGSKTYNSPKKGTQTTNLPLKMVRIPGQQESYVFRDLIPKMKYRFNISAVFQDGFTGPEQQLIVETKIEGKDRFPFVLAVYHSLCPGCLPFPLSQLFTIPFVLAVYHSLCPGCLASIRLFY